LLLTAALWVKKVEGQEFAIFQQAAENSGEGEELVAAQNFKFCPVTPKCRFSFSRSKFCILVRKFSPRRKFPDRQKLGAGQLCPVPRRHWLGGKQTERCPFISSLSVKTAVSLFAVIDSWRQ